MIKKILNEYAVCCKNTKWKALSGLIALITAFFIGYNTSDYFAKKERLVHMAKLAHTQELIKHKMNALKQKTIAFDDLQEKRILFQEMFKHKIRKDAHIACEKKLESIKEDYKKAACAICKSKKKDK